MKTLLRLLALAAAVVSTAVQAIGISIYQPEGGELDLAVLFASKDGARAQYAVPLGHFVLGVNTEKVVDVPVGDGTLTDWWLIAVKRGDVVYSSTRMLDEADLMSIEPFSLGDASSVEAVIAQLADVNGGGSFSSDIVALLNSGHASHVTLDRNVSRLWQFGSNVPPSTTGLIAVSLHDNIPPGFGPVPPVTEAATVLLLGSGLVALARMRGRQRVLDTQPVVDETAVAIGTGKGIRS